MLINIENIYIQKLKALSINGIQTDILRLDLVHPVISGNKWFKLKYYLEEAIEQNAGCLASFGGAYSNHIVALACAGYEKGIATKGFIRGDEATPLSPTLLEAKQYGMEMVFVDRTAYRDKDAIMQLYHQPGTYWIPEGGYGKLGAKGAGDILSTADTSGYDYIICATGTGTMLSGLVQAAQDNQHILGISVLKNHNSLMSEVASLNYSNKDMAFSSIQGYDFGGYAKHTQSLIDFMNELWLSDQLPTDFVYTAKLCYGVRDLIQTNQILPGSRLLLIHSGGLQGNRSFAPGRLLF